jgi:membrane protein required for colicin V production
MTPVDWLILAVILLNVILAAMQGFFAEAFSMAGLVVGYIVAAWQYPRLAEWLMSFLKSELLAEILSFLIIFFAILILFSVAGRVVKKLMKEVGLSAFDRFLGALLGLLKGALLVSVILMGLTAFTPTSSLLEKSELAPYFLVAGRAAIWVAPSALRARFYEGLDFLRRAPRDLSRPAAGK